MLGVTVEFILKTIPGREDSENSLTTELQLVKKENYSLQGYSDTQNTLILCCK